jgi:hypothetical protein
MLQQVQGLTAQMGVEFNDLVTSFTGDFVVAFSGVEPYMKETTSYNYSLGEIETKMEESYFPSVTLVAGLENDGIINKLISDMGERIIEKDGYFEIPDDDFQSYLIIKDGYLVVSTAEESVVNVKEGKINTNWTSTKSIGNFPTENSMFLYANTNLEDYDETMKKMIESESGAVPPQIFNSVTSKFDHISIMGSETTGKAVLKLRNTEHNSLYTLFKLFDDNSESMF